jgi:hypothetical protein
MSKTEIAVRTTDTIFNEIDQLHKAISQRATIFSVTDPGATR